MPDHAFGPFRLAPDRGKRYVQTGRPSSSAKLVVSGGQIGGRPERPAHRLERGAPFEMHLFLHLREHHRAAERGRQRGDEESVEPPRARAHDRPGGVPAHGVGHEPLTRELRVQTGGRAGRAVALRVGQLQAAVSKADPKEGAVVLSSPGRPREVTYGRAGAGTSLKLNVVSGGPSEPPAGPPPPAGGGAGGGGAGAGDGHGDGGAGSGAGSAGSRSDR